MTRRRLIWIGSVGTAITALCCFTPLLVVTLSLLGLGGLIAYLDLVLLPALVGFACLTGFAVWSRKLSNG